ncbi:MAG: hypothetical protein AABP62_12890 [Planctomycetota bacterium]
MPLTDLGSYVPTMDEVALHWTDVNVELGGAPATDLKLEGGFSRADLIIARDVLDALNISIEDLENGREIAAANRDNLKGTLRQKLGQFRGMLRALLPKSKYAAAAPILPAFGADESKFLGPFDDAASLWLRINADATLPGFTPPLVIAGLTQALFAAELATTRTAFAAIRAAENDLNVARKERGALLDPARERIVQYRSAVEGLFGTDHPLTQSLPALSPAPGSTPDESVLSGNWNPATGQADFTWTTSDNPNLQDYQLRMSPGPSYDAATATVVDTVSPGTLSLSTTAGLESPGDVASFKIFVRLTTSNEAGSNTVTITRP